MSRGIYSVLTGRAATFGNEAYHWNRLFPSNSRQHRMIGVARDTLTKDRAWLAERNNKLLKAEARLNTAFAKYLGN